MKSMKFLNLQIYSTHLLFNVKVNTSCKRRCIQTNESKEVESVPPHFILNWPVTNRFAIDARKIVKMRRKRENKIYQARPHTHLIFKSKKARISKSLSHCNRKTEAHTLSRFSLSKD